MQYLKFRAGSLSIAAVSAAIALYTQALYSQTPGGNAPPASDPQGMAPRAAPADYPAHAQAGAVTIAAEFKGHFVPTPAQTFTTEDYVIVEVGLFGPGKSQLSPDEFSIRINGKKTPSPAQSYVLVMSSLKDPEWEPPASSKGGSKTSFTGGGGGQGGGNDPPPAPVHMPPELQHAMNLKVQKASLAEGDRPLPQAGLLYFSYRGQTKSIRTIELLYKGPAGEAKLDLEP
jgi:hypothetical protein